MDRRVLHHPILGEDDKSADTIDIFVNGEKIQAKKGETVAAALMAAGIRVFRKTQNDSPRGYFCGIGRCSDCLMTVNGKPNVRTCMRTVEEGMEVETQEGLGRWNLPDEEL